MATNELKTNYRPHDSHFVRLVSLFACIVITILWWRKNGGNGNGSDIGTNDGVDGLRQGDHIFHSAQYPSHPLPHFETKTKFELVWQNIIIELKILKIIVDVSVLF